MNSPLTRRHISAKYDEELEQIRYQLLSFGGLVEQELRNAIVAIRGNDFTQAMHVSNILGEIEPIRSCIEDACENFIMLHQPSGKDLRLILAIVKMTGDLKVLVHLIKKVIRPVLEHQCVEWSPLEDLAKATIHMLHQVLDAVVRMDINAPKQWYDYNDHLDKIKRQISIPIVAQMQQSPHKMSEFLIQLRWTRLLENIGDTCQNICSHILIYAQTQHLLK